MTRSKKIVSHFGIIKSLEKSPFSQDVYLTNGCDSNKNIWISDVFFEPVITLSAGKQIEKAIWSRTCLTIIVSIIADFVNGLVLLVSLKIHFNSSEEQTSYAVSDGIGKVQSSKPLISLSSQKQNYCCIILRYLNGYFYQSCLPFGENV
ncbi:hypothetical protein QTP88_017992 [Uroleucon formosanum]